MTFEERLLRSIVRIHARFIADADPKPLFEALLADLLDLTESEYGLVGEIHHDPSGAPYLRTHALSDLAWNEETRRRYEDPVRGGIEFRRLDTLLGEVIRTAKPLIANDPASDPRSGGLPPGHPPLHAFLGIPLHHGGRFIGMLGVANREGGYVPELVERLGPFNATCASVIDVFRIQRRRRRAEETRDYLVEILERTTDYVGMADVEGRILYMNRAGRRVLGFPEAGDLSHESVLTPHTRASRRTLLKQGMPEAAREGWWVGDTTVIGADGREIPLSQVVIVHRDAEGRPALFSTIARDLTERRTLEAQLLHSQKMEAIGRLAGGIAHDINNILTVVIGFADVARRTIESGGDPSDSLDEIEQAATRAAGLTRQLLTFARRQVVEPREIDVNELAHRVERLLRRLIGEDVELQLELAPVPLVVRADPGQIEQVLVNLAVNARDAMPNGGRVRIETAAVELSGADLRGDGELAPGPYARIVVDDTGVGMSDETRARIFEPFFTTKPAGAGTGLGLSICYGIVKQSGGRIDVRTAPGRGARFEILLPRLDDARAEAASPRRAATTEAAAAPRTVLLVEDEPQVRALLERALRANGHRVIVATNGVEAIEAAAAAGPLDLVVTDVVMPRLGGPALVAALREKQPGLRVLYVSGHPSGAGFERELEGPGVGFLAKPFSADELEREVVAMLERR